MAGGPAVGHAADAKAAAPVKAAAAGGAEPDLVKLGEGVASGGGGGAAIGLVDGGEAATEPDSPPAAPDPLRQAAVDPPAHPAGADEPRPAGAAAAAAGVRAPLNGVPAAVPPPAVLSEAWRTQTRLRWAGLTAGLHAACGGGEASPPVTAPTAEAAPPATLDPPCPELEELLRPLRARLRRDVAESLAAYDASTRYPRPEDFKHESRDGYEQHLLGEALKELRRTVTRHFNHGSAGQVWRVVGGSSKEGIIVRKRREVGSPKEEERLSTGALLEQVELAEERLQYRLLEGTGPTAGWISTRLKMKSGEKDLAVRVELGDSGAQRSGAGRPRLAVLGLMASHICTEARLRRLRHVLRAVRQQAFPPTADVDFVFALSWSAATGDLEAGVERAVAEELLPAAVQRCDGGDLGDAAAAPAPQAVPSPRFAAVRQPGRFAQFQHLRAALEVAEASLRELRGAADGGDGSGGSSVWVVFGDDDDIWHRRRVAEYVGAIRAHPLVAGVGVFATTARVNCSAEGRIRDADMPVTPEEVDTFLKSRRGIRMDTEEACKTWRTTLRSRSPAEVGSLPVPAELCLEYFDLCPRLRLVREFFEGAAPALLGHRYCDLLFNEFLSSYPRRGREMGLEVAFFEPEPACWMLFYATPIPDPSAWERSVEGWAGDADGAGLPAIDVNNGHMSSTVSVEPAEEELARRVCEDFRHYEASITVPRLARYWAAVRNHLEVYLLRKVGRKVDQRVFDAFVFLAVNGSFFRFSERLAGMPQYKVEAACRMMYYIGQGYAKSLAASLGVDVLWHKPNIFLQPPEETTRYEYDVVAYPSVPHWVGLGAHGPSYGKGAHWKYGLPHSAALGYHGAPNGVHPWKLAAYPHKNGFGHPHAGHKGPPPHLNGGGSAGAKPWHLNGNGSAPPAKVSTASPAWGHAPANGWPRV